MENSGPNPMSQLPQLLEALLVRLEGMLAGQAAGDPARRATTEALLQRLRKQAGAMRAVANMAVGETLTPDQAATITQVPVPQPSVFPSWAKDKKESK